MKRTEFSILATAFGLLLHAASGLAQPRIVVDNPQQKVGEMVWKNPKTVTFAFQNRGSEPLVISEVHPSCGCVRVDYPRQAVAPGQRGEIAATYDAALMGTFYRELAVYTNAQESPLYLSFQGRVVESALDYDGDFPVDLGNVRLNTNYVEFNDVQKGDRPVVELQVANMEHGNYTPRLMHLPQYLEADYVPEVIQPGRVGKVRLTLDSEKLFMDGLNQTSVYLARYMGDKVSDTNEILVSAVLLPAFRDLTPERLQTAPHIVLMDGNELIADELAMPVEGKRKRVAKTISVTNIGEETLTVSAVQVFNRAMTVSLGERNIPPHGTTKLKIGIDTRELQRAKNGPRLLLISNDPRQPKTELNVTVN